jgi:hypothetical protein
MTRKSRCLAPLSFQCIPPMLDHVNQRSWYRYQYDWFLSIQLTFLHGIGERFRCTWLPLTGLLARSHLNCGNSSGCCCCVRLLTPFSSYHLNTNFGNIKKFHPLPPLPGSLRAAQRPRAVIFNKTDLWHFTLVWDIIACDNTFTLSLW